MAYSYSRRSKREAASACNTGPHISAFFFPLLITPFSFSVASSSRRRHYREAASAHNTSLFFPPFFSYASLFSPSSPRGRYYAWRCPCSSSSQLTTSFKIPVFSFHCNFTTHPTKCCCLGATSSGSQHPSTDPDPQSLQRAPTAQWSFLHVTVRFNPCLAELHSIQMSN